MIMTKKESREHTVIEVQKGEKYSLCVCERQKERETWTCRAKTSP